MRVDLLKGILAGVSISLGGILYLSCDPILGAFVFPFGLLCIYYFGWNLYTGRCCRLVFEPPSYFRVIMLAWVGNLIATVSMGYLVRTTGMPLIEKALEISMYKLSHGHFAAFILSVLCGFNLSVAVMSYPAKTSDFGRIFTVFLPVATLILANFEHVVTNMFFFSLADVWDAKAILYTAIYTVGNFLGCCTIPLIMRTIQRLQEKKAAEPLDPQVSS